LLDQKEAKLKAERCFCARAFTLARRSAGPSFFTSYLTIFGLAKAGIRSTNVQ